MSSHLFTYIVFKSTLSLPFGLSSWSNSSKTTLQLRPKFILTAFEVYPLKKWKNISEKKLMWDYIHFLVQINVTVTDYDYATKMVRSQCQSPSIASIYFSKLLPFYFHSRNASLPLCLHTTWYSGYLHIYFIFCPWHFCIWRPLSTSYHCYLKSCLTIYHRGYFYLPHFMRLMCSAEEVHSSFLF